MSRMPVSRLLAPALAVVVAMILAMVVAGCASQPDAGGSTPKSVKAPLVTTTNEEEQRDKALSTRIAAGIEAIKARDPERARRHLVRALEMAPKSAEAHNAMALLYGYEGDEAREEYHYKKAIRYDSSFSQARNNYATMLYRQERYKSAIRQLERATNDTSYDQRAIAFLNLGRCYAKVGEHGKALKSLERSLRLDSNYPDTFLELADVTLALGRFADARAYWEAYNSRAKPLARSLWIGIRIEQALGDRQRVSGYEMQLESLFKGTVEHTQWQAWKRAGSPLPTQKEQH